MKNFINVWIVLAVIATIATVTSFERGPELSAKSLLGQILDEKGIILENVDIQNLREEVAELYRRRQEGEMDQFLFSRRMRKQSGVGGEVIDRLDPILLRIGDHSVGLTVTSNPITVYMVTMFEGMTEEEYRKLMRKQFDDKAKKGGVRRAFLHDKLGEHFLLFAYPELE